MEKQQEKEWAKAQKNVISENLVDSTKQQLQFLEAVDRNCHLYDGPALQRAIYQLNLLSYAADCKDLFGRILDNRNVMSSVQTNFRKQTEQIWEMIYPNEPYELNPNVHLENADENKLVASQSTNFDLVSAVKRQSPFFYQVSRPCTKQLCNGERDLVHSSAGNCGDQKLTGDHKGNLLVSISEKQPYLLFIAKRRLSILSEVGEKQIAAFQSEANGELVLELMFYSHCDLSGPRWIELGPTSGIVGLKPISLRIAVSVTAPVPAPYAPYMVQGKSSSRNTSLFLLPKRESRKLDGGKHYSSKKEVIGMNIAGETDVLAEFLGEGWSLMSSSWAVLENVKVKNGILTRDGGSMFFAIFVNKFFLQITIYQEIKLGYEIKNSQKKKTNEGGDFMTVIEFSDKDVYGKEVALLNLRSGFLKVEEQWLVLPAITLACILSHILKKEGYNRFATREEKDIYRCSEQEESPLGGACPLSCGLTPGGACGGGGYHAMVQSQCLSGWTRGGGCGGGGSCGSGCGGECGGKS
ncbi:hypothetical protein LguiA_004053 [Lonicera macranthoides]